MDRPALCRPARRGPRLRRGLRLGPPRPPRRRGDRGRRESRGVRTRSCPLPPPETQLPARTGGGLRPGGRRGGLPPDHRAHPRPRQAARPDRRDRSRCVHLDAEPPHPRPARRGEVGQPMAPARIRRRPVPRAARAPLPQRRAARPLPRPQAARTRARHPRRLGQSPSLPPHHQAVLRPVHPGDQRRGLPAARGWPGQGARLPGDLPRLRDMAERTVGDLAIVLHSHMPYVEGYGTYPFGEEWLFDAVARSHLPVLDVADRLTMTITPVLADQLEAEGVGERMLGFLRRHRVDAADRDVADAGAGLRPAAKAETDHYTHAMTRLGKLGGDPLRAFQEVQAEGRVALMASAATHAVLPKLATQAGRRLQVDAGVRSHTRRFGAAAEGFWLPECAYVPGLEAILAERALAHTCLDQSALEEGAAALTPVRLPGGPVGFTIDWPTVALVWSEDGYPSDPSYLEYHRLSPNGMRLWSISGDPYDPAAAADRASEHASTFLGAVRDRLEQHRSDRGSRGLCVFAIDTELLGHWWAEGPLWLREVVRGAEAEGVRLLTLPEALREHEPEDRPVAESSWGEGKSLETWDSPSVSDLVWAPRRSELRLLRALGMRSVGRDAALRAARELLALQSSDWAFMDHRGQAGDYPYTRATDHAQALLEAIDSPEAVDARVRNLAPDLSLAPLLEP